MMLRRQQRRTSLATEAQEHSAGREKANNGQCPHRNLQADLGMIGLDGAPRLGCGRGCNIMRPGVTGTSSDHGKPTRPPAKGTALDELRVPTAHGTGPDGPASASTLPAQGTRIGQYELIRELGRGGMGAVYAARDTKLGRKVAIKLLNSNHHPELTARFILEAKATAACNHENIIVIHEVGEHDGNPFMVLEYLQGAPLTQLLQDGRKLPAAQVVELMVPAVGALTVAHAHNIVHRDLKP